MIKGEDVSLFSSCLSLKRTEMCLLVDEVLYWNAATTKRHDSLCLFSGPLASVVPRVVCGRWSPSAGGLGEADGLTFLVTTHLYQQGLRSSERFSLALSLAVSLPLSVSVSLSLFLYVSMHSHAHAPPPFL